MMSDFMDPSKHEIATKCPACDHEAKFTLDQVGGSIVCPGCQQSIYIAGQSSRAIEQKITGIVRKGLELQSNKVKVKR